MNSPIGRCKGRRDYPITDTGHWCNTLLLTLQNVLSALLSALRLRSEFAVVRLLKVMRECTFWISCQYNNLHIILLFGTDVWIDHTTSGRLNPF